MRKPRSQCTVLYILISLTLEQNENTLFKIVCEGTGSTIVSLKHLLFCVVQVW